MDDSTDPKTRKRTRRTAAEWRAVMARHAASGLACEAVLRGGGHRSERVLALAPSLGGRGRAVRERRAGVRRAVRRRRGVVGRGAGARRRLLGVGQAPGGGAVRRAARPGPQAASGPDRGCWPWWRASASS